MLLEQKRAKKEESMVDISLIIILVLGVSTLFSVYTLFKTGFTFWNILSLVISFGILVLSIGLYMDAKEFQEKFEASPKLFLLQENDVLLAGFSGKLVREDETPVLMTEDELRGFQEDYDQQQYDAMLGANYKLFIVNLTVLNNITGEIVVDNNIYTKEYLIGLLRSPNPLELFVDDLAARENVSASQQGAMKEKLLAELKKESPTDAAFKARIFGMLLRQAISEQGPLFILTQFKQGFIRIHKETIIFTTSKYLPQRYLQQLISAEVPGTTINARVAYQVERGDK